MKTPITVFSLLAVPISGATVAQVAEPDGIVDCFYQANAGHPLCK